MCQLARASDQRLTKRSIMSEKFDSSRQKVFVTTIYDKSSSMVLKILCDETIRRAICKDGAP